MTGGSNNGRQEVRRASEREKVEQTIIRENRQISKIIEKSEPLKYVISNMGISR